MPVTVAVLGAGSLIGLGIIRALRMASPEYRVVGLDAFAESVGLYWSDSAHLLPDVLADGVTEDAYLDRLVEILREERVDVLLPALDFDLLRLARRRAELEKASGAVVVVSSPAVAAISDDKWATYEFLAAKGLPCPPSLVDLAALDRFVADYGFPLIVKPRRGARSRGVSLVCGAGELPAALALAGPEPVVQVAVGTPDREYTCGAVVLDGECVGAVVMRRDLREGNTRRAYLRADPELEELVRAAAAALEPCGPVNFQLRVGATGPAIFEINARFSGTTVMRARAGFNEVDAVVRWAVHGERPALAVQRSGVFLRYWDEHFVEWDTFEAMQRRAPSP